MPIDIYSAVSPTLASVQDAGLRERLQQAFESSAKALQQVQQTFERFASRRWSPEQTCCFMKSWHSTHLKMLPIYGLSCRLQKRGLVTADEVVRNHYFMAAAHNAETSYEDLSLEMPEWKTHSELFDEMAKALCGSDDWKLDRYCLPEAAAFRKWIYNNMVMDDLETGLLTNLFSEIYNHGEYSLALEPFQHLMLKHFEFDSNEVEKHSLYIKCHVESDVEEAHFNCVIVAMNHYFQATEKQFNYTKALKLFNEYLSRSGEVMAALEAKLN